MPNWAINNDYKKGKGLCQFSADDMNTIANLLMHLKVEFRDSVEDSGNDAIERIDDRHFVLKIPRQSEAADSSPAILYQVRAMRAYRPDIGLVPIGEELATDTLQPTWDWIRAHG